MKDLIVTEGNCNFKNLKGQSSLKFKFVMLQGNYFLTTAVKDSFNSHVQFSRYWQLKLPHLLPKVNLKVAVMMSYPHINEQSFGFLSFLLYCSDLEFHSGSAYVQCMWRLQNFYLSCIYIMTADAERLKWVWILNKNVTQFIKVRIWHHSCLRQIHFWKQMRKLVLPVFPQLQKVIEEIFTRLVKSTFSSTYLN